VNWNHESIAASYAGRRAAKNTSMHDYFWFDPLEFRNDEWWCTPGLCYPQECCLDEPFDNAGHGTHVMGTIAGSIASGVGVAPGVEWVAAKGCRDAQCLIYGTHEDINWIFSFY
jgi:subtilisin family serine protease